MDTARQPRARPALLARALPAVERPPLRDFVVAGVLTVVAVVAAYGEAHPTNPSKYFTGGHHLPDTPDAAFLLVILAGAVLAWRHLRPRTVLVISTAAVAVFSLLGYVNGVALLLPAVALGTLASMVPIHRSAVWAAAVTVVLMAATAANNPLGAFSGGFVLIPANFAVALFVGIAIGNRRSYVAAERERAEREARRQVDEERLRIARELHDVVAHTMATINVQASAASALLREQRPEEATESLSAIRAASKDGLRELRAILNVLRHADEPADTTRPVPGLARLDALAEGVRAAGLPVTITVTGRPRELPAVTDLAAFRIIQEALTNTIRHAGTATATVVIRYGTADLGIEVTDTGRGPAAPGAMAALATHVAATGNGAGHGLRGMRERAAAAGGTIEIGRAPAGGFRVAALLPFDAPAGPDAVAADNEPEVLR